MLDALNRAAVCAVRALLRVLLPFHHEVFHFLKGRALTSAALLSQYARAAAKLEPDVGLLVRNLQSNSNNISTRHLHRRLYIDAALA